MERITINSWGPIGYIVVIETKSGKRYTATYHSTWKPKEEDVREDFKYHKDSFNQIN